MMRIFQRKANIIFSQITIIVFVFAIVFLYSFSSLYSQLLLISSSAMNKLESVCGCTNHFSFFSHPYFYSAIFLLGLSMAIYCGYILLKFIKLYKSTKHFVRENLSRKKNLSKKLKSVLRYTEMENKVTEINSEKPVIFCYSFFRPKVCISSELVKRLDKKELVAVLLHEKMHVKNIEPLKLFFVKNSEKILFFLPRFKFLAKQYSVYSEMAADEFATNGFRNKTPLAGALCKVLDLEKKLILNDKSCAVSFFNITNERVNKLINSEYSPQYKFTFVKFSLNVFILVFMAFSFLQIKNFDLVLAETHEKDACVISQVTTEDDCKSEREVEINDLNGHFNDKFFQY